MTIERAERLRQAALAAHEKWISLHDTVIHWKTYTEEHGRFPVQQCVIENTISDASDAHAVYCQAMQNYKDALKALGHIVEGFNDA